MLISRSGEVVPKNEIIDAVWAETAVEENNLTQQIAACRALGERPSDHRYIVTVPEGGTASSPPSTNWRSPGTKRSSSHTPPVPP